MKTVFFQVTDGWLEPLLDIVAKNSSVIACPVIDTIQDDTFEYMVRMHAQNVFLDPTRHPFPAQTCRVGSLLGGRIHLESHFHLASAAAATEVYNYYIPIIIYMIFILYMIHILWRHFYESNILPGLLLLQPLFPPPRWPAVCLQSPATSFSNWAATTQASISGEGRISSWASRPGCAPEGFSLCLAAMSGMSSGDNYDLKTFPEFGLRKRSPYQWQPGSNLLRKNLVRVAEVSPHSYFLVCEVKY